MADPATPNLLRVAFGSPLHEVREVVLFLIVVAAAAVIAVSCATAQPPCVAAHRAPNPYALRGHV